MHPNETAGDTAVACIELFDIMKYRKKPVVIEAEQFNTDPNAVWGFGDGPKLVKTNDRFMDYPVWLDEKGPHLLIPTLEGTLRAENGDWIITGVKGERYPCKPDIFAATYECAEPTPADVVPTMGLDINDHPIFKHIYDLCIEIEKLPASEQATKTLVMAGALSSPARQLITALRDAISVYRDDDKTSRVTDERLEAWKSAAATK